MSSFMVGLFSALVGVVFNINGLGFYGGLAVGFFTVLIIATNKKYKLLED